MPNQPGCSMFPLDNRPKQTRQRRKKTTPGALNQATADERRGPRPRPASLRRTVDNGYSASTTSSAPGSASSGSSSSIGPVRYSRPRRARKQDEGVLGIGIHYDNWVDPSDDQRSPTSTEGTTPKTPESWGSPMSAVSPPGRRNAVSEGPLPVLGTSLFEPPRHRVASSTSGERNSPRTQTIHEPPHIVDEYSGLHAFASNPHAPISIPTLQRNHDRSLIPLPNTPFSYDLAVRAFNPTNAPFTLPTSPANDFWTNVPSAPSRPQYSLEHCYSQAADCFPPQYLSSNPATASPFDTTHYLELEPNLSAQAEFYIPGGYPSSPGIDTSMLMEGGYVDNSGPCSSSMLPIHGPSATSCHDSNMHFASPNE